MDARPPRSSLQSIQAEFHENDSKNKWALLYQQIRNQCLNYEYAVSEAKKTQNKNLNRYRDVSPYDHSRVVLGQGSCDYINASLIQMEKAHRKYILTQGPLPHTTGHFWLMVWEQKCKAVLMLNRVIEKNQIKCHQYWPLGSDPLHLDEVGFRIEQVGEPEEASYYMLRRLRLTRVSSGEEREVLHFHYTTWPDFGVPQSPTAFLNFLLHVRRSGALNSNVGPPVVHCSAGIGRSGTFCLVDSCLVLIEECENEVVDVKEVLLEMRRYRMGLIQTPDQLRFSYQAIIEGAKFLANHSEEEDLPVSNHVVAEEKAEEEEEGPPPQPPPRHESLARGIYDAPQSRGADCEEEEEEEDGEEVEEAEEDEEEEDEGEEVLPGPPDRPLPSLPSRNFNGTTAESSSIESSRELRKRKRQEETDRISEKVRSMKKKQKEAEMWRQLRRSLFKPLTIGLGLVLLGGGAYVCMRYYYRG